MKFTKHSSDRLATTLYICLRNRNSLSPGICEPLPRPPLHEITCTTETLVLQEKEIKHQQELEKMSQELQDKEVLRTQLDAIQNVSSGDSNACFSCL